jgi:predicted ATPase
VRLLERETFLGALEAELQEAAAGGGRVVLLGGEAGVGKTALVERFVDDQRGSGRVLWGACDALLTPRPLGPLLDIAAEVGGPLAAAAAAASRPQVFAALLGELRSSRQATLVVLEDVHWADEATLDLLRFLVRRLRSTHALLVVTFRDDEVAANRPLQAAIGELATLGTVRRLVLPPLSVEAVRELAGDAGLDPAELHRRTGGNPFFVTEVLAAGGVGTPSTVRDAVLARTARLGGAAREALDAVAVVGSPAELTLIEAVLGEGVSALDDCFASGVLRADAGAVALQTDARAEPARPVVGAASVAFRHELARTAVEEAIPPHRRRDLHRRVLAALLASGVRPELARLAHHAEAAGDAALVLEYAPAAAARAAELGAHREAAAQYARALRFTAGLAPARVAELLERRSYECYLTGTWTPPFAPAVRRSSAIASSATACARGSSSPGSPGCSGTRDRDGRPTRPRRRPSSCWSRSRRGGSSRSRTPRWRGAGRLGSTRTAPSPGASVRPRSPSSWESTRSSRGR